MRTHVLALLVAATLVGGLELGLRGLGYEPAPFDGGDLWALTRERASGDPGAIALLGSSRMQTGIDVDVLAQRTAKHPVMLAILGSSAAPALRDLARDPTFEGDVLVEFGPLQLFDPDGEPEARVHAVLARRDALRASLTGYAEARVELWLQQRLVVLNGDLDAFDLAHAAFTGALPAPPTAFRADRSRRLDPSRIRPVPTRRRPPAGEAPAGRTEVLDAMLADARAIEARGGRVTWVAFPAEGPQAEQEDRQYPRARFWDRLGPDAFHWRDHPRTAAITPADPLHLAPGEATVFTEVLASWLSR